MIRESSDRALDRRRRARAPFRRRSGRRGADVQRAREPPAAFRSPAAATATARASSSRPCAARTAAFASRSDIESARHRRSSVPPTVHLVTAPVLRQAPRGRRRRSVHRRRRIPADELRARIAGKDALVCLLTDAVDRSVIDAAPRLKTMPTSRSATTTSTSPTPHRAGSSSPTRPTCSPSRSPISRGRSSWRSRGGCRKASGWCAAASGRGGRSICCWAPSCAASSSV